MKKLAVPFVVALAIGVVGLFAFAQEVSSDPANCGLNARQVEAGWTCTEEVVVVANVSRMFDDGVASPTCQDATITTTTYRSYNPAGKLAEERTITTGPEQSGWSLSYPVSMTNPLNPAPPCNYPLQ